MTTDSTDVHRPGHLIEDQVRQEYRDGASIAALARRHRVSRVAIRTALADLLPGRPEQPGRTGDEKAPPVRVEMPGKVARHLIGHIADLGDLESQALRQGREVRRGQGYSLHVTAPADVHQALPAAAETVGESAPAADRKASRISRDRLNAVAA
ncbi:hypothetical protein ABZV91_02815 [Nocardia sp. NPDC004568]|uniref:hypothetical protein n=1 Tax=Nocardia sp. NPDC004568 TaxID=3154551 RepID=UPI0033B020A6